jgi:hypothetical protein
MTDETPHNKETGILLKVLTAHYHSLVSAGSDETVLKQYSALLRFLKSRGGQFRDAAVQTGHRSEASTSPTITDKQLRTASLEDLEKLIVDPATARRDLEYIAIRRFSVPRGSMRSFSNKQMLVDKLRTLISNERTHETIGAVARGQAKQSESSR